MSILSRTSPLAAAAVLLLSAACSSQHNPVPNNPAGATCSLGTQVQLSNPTPGSVGVPANIGKIQIVVDANTDLLGASWNLILVDQFGNKTTGGTFTLTSNPGGPHPYPNDYYYNSTVSQLSSGTQFTAYLNQFTSQCAPLFVGSFST